MKDFHELEIYATIKDFPNYLATSHGRVLSLKDSNGNDRILELKQHKNKRTGYNQVNLWKYGCHNTKNVHRLVAEVFIPNPDNKSDVNHIDEDKTNNHVTNLEWMTRKENINYGTHNERVSKTNSDGRLKGQNNPMYGKKHTIESKQKMSKSSMGKKHSEETKQKFSGINNHGARCVIGFKLNGCDIKYYKYIKECEKEGFIPSNIVKCCRKRQKHHKGYVWYYADEYFNKTEVKENE